ncbi:hypothetical protein [Romboutsia hominis]|nr:hypothetical protein [Romboutsia hominis]MCH1959742.1 hypothetical protein [Romboutsia hominis]MCH1969837.1 hypothetical protein [Romboutsia hominis]
MENKFPNGHYKDAIEYAKYILSNSSSIKEIAENINELEKEDDNKKSSDN